MTHQAKKVIREVKKNPKKPGPALPQKAAATSSAQPKPVGPAQKARAEGPQEAGKKPGSDHCLHE